MKSINTYYTTKEDLESFIQDSNLQNASSLLIQVFSAIVDKSFLSTLLSELETLLPEAEILGTTTDGEIMNGKVSSGKVVLNFTQFEQTSLKTAAIAHTADGYHSGQYLAKELIGEETKLLIAFTDGIHTNGEAFLKGIASVNEDVIVAGGAAGDNSRFIDTLVFTKQGIFNHGAVAVSLDSEHLHIHKDYSFGWHPIGNELTVTSAERNRVHTINGKSAVDVYAHYLGEEIAKGLPGVGIEFPLMVHRNGSTLSRACIAKEKDGSLMVGGNVYTGEKVRIGYGNSSEILKKSKNIFASTARHPSEAIFVYSCMTRRHFLGSKVESEIMPLQTLAPVSGFFTYGEFFTSTQKALFNQTMTLLSLSESDTLPRHIPEEIRQPNDINSTSIEALTHLINVTSKEVQAQTDALRQSNQLNQELKERMELALLGSNDGIWDWNILDNTVYFSPRWKEMLGYADNELANGLSTWSDRIHPDDIDRTWADIYKNLHGETEYYENEHRLRHRDGHWVWILDRGKVQFNADRTATRMLGTHTDITEEKETQLKLLHQAQIIEQTHEPVNTTDLRGNITSWNKGSEALFGYTADEVMGKPIAMLFEPEAYQAFVQHMPALMKEGEYRCTLTLFKKSKVPVLINLSLSLLRDNENVPTGIVGYLQDITEQKQAEDALLAQQETLQYQAHYDALTGLPNRVLFTDRLAQSIQRSKRHQEGFALFFIDLDNFKHINDSLGHDVGDEVLKVVAQRIHNVIREEDTLARLSGDEFTLIMEDLMHPENATVLAESILHALETVIVIDRHTIYLTGSIGIAVYPQDATDTAALLKYADTAMYKAKQEGRNTFQFYAPEMTDFALKRMEMKTHLRQAIENEEFVICYQSQVDASTNTLIGVEALIRWQHPTLGLLSPDAFIPLAEETGIIVEIDQLVMRTAMKQMAQWYKKGLNPGRLGLNISIQHLERGDFLQKIKDCLNRNDFRANWLELEITERQMLKKPEEVIKKLGQIQALGIGISIDDFGTGYSSLSLLKRLPINRLKIDRSFIQDIPQDDEDMAIVRTIIVLAKSLNLDLIAEGIETAAQRDFLIDNGCHYFQGHYYSRPILAEEMEAVLLQNRKA
ncbi:MAG TPA: EAL domain-containing protein [Sulfurovum sp.]|uniref:bifunctional diguanylate cyclase/phosphodiesterase n=1 Tax=Sulfurovum sp. TaxID=1969726 RepID=UPI002F947962